MVEQSHPLSALEHGYTYIYMYLYNAFVYVFVGFGCLRVCVRARLIAIES